MRGPNRNASKTVSAITSRQPDANLGFDGLVVCDIVLKKQISRGPTNFISGQKPVMVCLPSYAADFLAADVTQLLWMNLRSEGMIKLLQGSSTLCGTLWPSTDTTNNKRGKSKTSLKPKRGRQQTWRQSIDSSTSCMKMHYCSAKLSTSDVGKVRAGRLLTSSSHRRLVGVSKFAQAIEAVTVIDSICAYMHKPCHAASTRNGRRHISQPWRAFSLTTPSFAGLSGGLQTIWRDRAQCRSISRSVAQERKGVISVCSAYE